MEAVVQKISRRKFLANSAKAVIALTFAPQLVNAQVASDGSPVKIDGDKLIENLADYLDKTVDISGEAIHVCPVNGMKLKLKTTMGNIIKIIPDNDAIKRFNPAFNKKSVRITGVVKEERIPRERIMKYAKDKTLLCHIDYTRCIDAKWIESMVKSGNADKYVADMTQELTDKMAKTGENYISVVRIIATSIEEEMNNNKHEDAKS